MKISEVAEYFYENSKSAVTSTHWSHLDEFDQKFFKQDDWLKNFLSRWISVGFNDVTVTVEDRWKKKRAIPLEKIQLSDESINRDHKFAESLLTYARYCRRELLTYIGSETCGPVHTINLVVSERSVKTSFHDLALAYYADKSHQCLRLVNKSFANVVEVGSGYGGLIEKILRGSQGELVNNVFLIDLPFNLAVQHYFLSESRRLDQHKHNIILADDYSSEKNNSIVLVPIDKIERIPVANIDLFINTRSFGEMTKDQINNYFYLLHKVMTVNGIFFNSNRTLKRDAHGAAIELSDYPYDCRWALISQERTPIFWPHFVDLVTIRTEVETELFKKTLQTLS